MKSNGIRRLVLSAMVVGALSVGMIGGADVNADTVDAVENPTVEAIAMAKPSVVSVLNMQVGPNLFQRESQDPTQAGTGSGVIYKLTDDYAYVVTNHHVIERASSVLVNTEDGESFEAEVLGSDIWTDLAVLRIDRGDIDTYVTFADSDELVVGETAIAIGSPLGELFSGSASRGIVSGLDRTVPIDFTGDGTYDWEASVIQTDAAINPGNSGGALINDNGELIGINSMKIALSSVEGIGFAIPSNDVKNIVEQLEEHGQVNRPYMGVYLEDVRNYPQSVLESELGLPESVRNGVILSQIEAGSPAEQAGLQRYDVIVELDGSEVESLVKLRQYLYYEKESGDTMDIVLYRDGREMAVEMVLR